jgi:hypothetical protein
MRGYLSHVPPARLLKIQESQARYSSGATEGWVFRPVQLVSENAGVEKFIVYLPIEHPLCGEATGASIFPVLALLYGCFSPRIKR